MVGSVAAGVFLYMNQAMFTSINSVSTLNTRAVCKSSVEGTLNNIRALGLSQYVHTLDLDSENLPSQVKESMWVSSGERWDKITKEVLETQGNGTVTAIHSHKMVEGYMSTLQAIFNKSSRYCNSEFGDRHSPPGSGPPLFVELDNIGKIDNSDMYIKIELLNKNTGQTTCSVPGGGPVVLMPKGRSTASSFRPANTETDYDFRVTITNQYTTEEGEQRNCAAIADFGYPQLEDLSLSSSSFASNVSASVSLTRPSAGSQSCTTQRFTGSFTLNVSRNNNIDRGQVFVCRDASDFFATSIGSNPAIDGCSGGGGPGAPSVLSQAQANTIDSSWKNCSEVTLCGQAHSSSNNNSQTISLQYSNIPWSCNARVEIKAVDPALNESIIVANGPENSSLGQYGGFCRRPSCPCGPDPPPYCPPASAGGCTPCPPPPPPPAPPAVAGGGAAGGGGAAPGGPPATTSSTGCGGGSTFDSTQLYCDIGRIPAGPSQNVTPGEFAYWDNKIAEGVASGLTQEQAYNVALGGAQQYVQDTTTALVNNGTITNTDPGYTSSDHINQAGPGQNYGAAVELRNDVWDSGVAEPVLNFN